MLRIDLNVPEEAAARFPDMPDWMAGLLYSRGIRSAAEAERFLHPGMDQLLPPMLLRDMDRAAALLLDARDRGQQAVIYGDYDVDGVCASAILLETFRRMKLESDVYIPDRHREGYGLNLAAVEKLAERYQVLVTVDCGITSVKEVARARELGMRTIVTDHHRPGDALPPADAVVSPLLGEYPFPYLCGAGVAWKLAMALLGQDALPLMELAALATVADMVSLTGENRCIVALGLEKLSATARPGLRAVMNRAGIFGRVTSEQVGFQIAPRMNACGRMESARTALEMLTTRDLTRAEELALKLEGLNRERKDQEARVITGALAQVEQMDLVDSLAIVVRGESWNSGVVGLAAGRIAEQYAYPTVALSQEGELCVGSARSAGDIDIHRALSRCGDLFLRFGGHKQAAGLTIRTEHVEEFARRLSQAVAEQTGGMPPEPHIRCDGEMTLGQVTEETVKWLEKLEPCGVGNPAPLFLCRDVRPLSMRAVGTEGRHLKCTFRQGNDLRDGILFGGGSWAGQDGGHFQLVMTPTLNEFRGKVSAECRLYALQLLPETVEKNPEAEAIAYLAEELSDETVPVISEKEAAPLMAGGQGTLLVCRCLETALKWRARFPQADFCLMRADDPRAYHTIMLRGTAGNACASFRHVVLCDGDLGEGASYARACPRARVTALPVTQAGQEMLRSLWVDEEGLRDCCRHLLRNHPPDLTVWAADRGLNGGQAAFALKTLEEIGLIEREEETGRLALKSGVRRSPRESALYRRVKQAKEATDGLYGL